MELYKPVTGDNQLDQSAIHWKRKEGHVTSSLSYDNLKLQNQSPSIHKVEERPISRRGMMSRQGPTMVDRPMTSTRPRPPSARGSMVPGTASRLTSARLMPPSRAGTAINMASAQVSVMDRPITQQGLSGLRTGTRGPQMRQVQDKRFFEGVLQIKIRELSTEVGRLGRDIESQTREQATFLVYDKRVKEMAAELTEMQGQLADYNLVVDKLNTDTEKGEVDNECRELRTHNNQEANQIEQLFAQRQQKEMQIQQLEVEIEQERHMTDNLLAAMHPPLRERYAELQHTNSQLQKQMEGLQQQLDTLTTHKAGLEDQLAVSQLKQEAVHLRHKLCEAEERRDGLLEKERSRTTPAQEYEQLLQRVRDDNAEIATMVRQSAELKEEIRKKQEELDQTEQDLDDSQSERHQKYRELRRREETMEQFLATFEESRNQELERLTQIEAGVVAALSQASRNLARSGHLPSPDDFSVMRDNLAFKEGELDKSKKTVDGLVREQQQLQSNLSKVEALEEKIKVEMGTLRQKVASMTSEMGLLSDLETLQNKAHERRTQLEAEQAMLEERQRPARASVLEAQQKHDHLKRELMENETYAQLTNLERKLMQLEQNNFAMKEFVESKRSETDYEPLKAKVYQLVQNYNIALKENLKRGGVAP